MSRARTAVLVVAVLLVAVNLRPAVVAVSPLVGQIRADLGISSTVAGLLTTLPVLCFGALAPLGAWVSRRVGVEVTLLAAMLVLSAGVLVRLAPSLLALLGGSILIGAAIAAGNTLMPVVVKRDFPRHTGPMTGAYSTMLSGGGALAAAVMVPIERGTGFAWRPALALWAIASVVAAVLWIVAARPRRPRAHDGADASEAEPAITGLWRSLLAWQVTLFMGLQSLQFYAVTAWVPTIFVDAGFTPSTAGLLLSLAGLVSVFTSFLTPVLAARRATQFHLVAALITVWAAGYIGLVLAPVALAPLWMVLVGTGQGIGISLALTLITLRAPDHQHTSRLSGMAQGIGYCIAAAGPLGLGAVHDATGGWGVPMITLLVLLVPLTVVGMGAARNRHVRGRGTGAVEGDPQVQVAG